MMKRNNKGFTAVELIISIFILIILLKVTVSVFASLSNSQSLDRDAQSVLSVIEKARTMAINSVGGSEHGVKFSAQKVEIFEGTDASAGAIEATYDLPAKSKITIVGGLTSLYFAKLTGNASANGTVKVEATSGGLSKTIIIYGTGISEIQ
jgi:Tfp pilus assembly protein FimT